LDSDATEGKVFKDKITEYIFAISFGLWAGVLGVSTKMILDKMESVAQDVSEFRIEYMQHRILSTQDVIELRERQAAVMLRIVKLETEMHTHRSNHEVD